MDCKNIRKQINEYVDGTIDLSVFSAHLKECEECRQYYHALLHQKELLGSFAPQNPPKFDLLAAKRRKKAQLSRKITLLSAAAAVFVVILISGPMLSLFSAKSAAPETARAIAEDSAAAYGVIEETFEESAVAEEAPAAEEAVEEAAEVYAEEAVEEAAEQESAEAQMIESGAADMSTNECILPANGFDALRNSLDNAGIAYNADQDILVHIVTANSLKIIAEYFPSAEINMEITFIRG